MPDCTFELAGVLWAAWRPRDTSCADNRAILLLSAVGQSHLPDAFDSFDPLDRTVESDRFAQPVGVSENLCVLQDLTIARIVGVGVGHREVEEPRRLARRDEVCGLIHRRAGIVEVPDAA